MAFWISFASVIVILYTIWYLKDKIIKPGYKVVPQYTEFPHVPFLGSALALGKDPIQFLINAYHKVFLKIKSLAKIQCGEVFRIDMFGSSMVFLLSEEGHEFFFRTPEEIFSASAAYKFTVPTFGPGVVYDAPLKVMYEQFGFFKFDTQSDKKYYEYVKMVLAECEEYFPKHWGEQGQTDLFESMCEIFTLTSARCLMGAEMRARWGPEYHQLYQDLDKSFIPILFFFPNIPNAYARSRDAARKKLTEIFTGIIHERRKNGSGHTDFLQMLIDARYKDGSQLSEEHITGLMISLVLGGQHTSNVTSTWTMLEIINSPEWKAKVTQYLNNYLPEGIQDLDYEKVRGMDVMENCLKETLRLHPPFYMIMRLVMQDIEYKGMKIKKGNFVALSPMASHRLPIFHNNPTQFNPDRFTNAETAGNSKHAWIPFGGGRHVCIGRKFALMQLKVVLSYLLRTYDIELPAKELPKSNFNTMVVAPVAPVTVKYKRRV